MTTGGGIDHFAFPYSIQVPGFFGYTQGRSGITATGPYGGIQAGYNYELPFFHLVAGVEIDSSVSGIRGQTSVNGTINNGLPVNATFGSKFEDFGTARVRLGYAWGRFLPYLTAGFTYATTQTYFNGRLIGKPLFVGNTKQRLSTIIASVPPMLDMKKWPLTG